MEGTSDEISNEFEFSHELAPDGLDYDFNDTSAQHVSNTHALPSGGSVATVDHVKELSALSKQELIRKYVSMLKSRHDPNFSASEEAAEQDLFKAFQIRNEEEGGGDGTTTRPARDLMDALEDLDSGGEIPDGVYDLHDQGRFNQKNPNDGSREEVRSSWSSSEEALAACEGLIYNVPLNGGTRCTPDASRDTLRNITTEVR